MTFYQGVKYYLQLSHMVKCGRLWGAVGWRAAWCGVHPTPQVLACASRHHAGIQGHHGTQPRCLVPTPHHDACAALRPAGELAKLVRTNIAERPSLGAWPKCVSAHYRCELRLGRVANVLMWLGWQGK